MCGIAGFLPNQPRDSQAMSRILRHMGDLIAHRGPDGAGYHVVPGIGLVHRRLSIIDLEGGSQPLFSHEGKLALIANGEIYNYRELRQRFQGDGYHFRTHSDSEVILPLYQRYGDDCVRHLDGIFAFALWDAERERLLLARDQVGVKPLHLLEHPEGIAFASEVKAFLALPWFKANLNRPALSDFLQLRYIPGDQTLFTGVTRLMPGEAAVVEKGAVRRTRYYQSPTPRTSNPNPPSLDVMRAELSEAVSSQLVADVPIACYLSGGYDSTTVTALANRAQPGIRSFTLGFGEPTDENEDGARAARDIGTTHTDLRVNASLFDELPRAVWHLEEPKINGVQGFILARETAQHVRVALSGLGGDELFCGYERNGILWKLGRLATFERPFAPLLRMARTALDRALRGGRRLAWDHHLRGAVLMLSLFDPAQADLILRNGMEPAPNALGGPLSREFLREMHGQPGLVERSRADFSQALESCQGQGALLGSAMHHEFRTKLAHDYLLNEDRTSMAHGLEVRVPLLRPKLVEAMRQVPLTMLMAGGRTKGLMREVIRPIVPQWILDKPKWGFQISAVHQWEHGIRPRFLEQVDRQWIRELGVFDQAWIDRVLEHPPSARLRWHYFVMWMILGLRHWHRQFMEGAGAP